MFTSIISLLTANWSKWAKLFTDLLALFIGFIYSLVLFIGFAGFIYWIYLLALLIHFIYSLALFIRFGGFIYGIYLLALVLTYKVSILIAISLRFSHSSERNTFIFLSLYISHALMEKIFHFSLRHHTHLIKLTLLQLHLCTSLIILTNIRSLHQNYNRCPILTLHYSNITSHYSESIHSQILADIQLLHLPSIFISLTQRCASHSISNYTWNTSKLLIVSSYIEINPGA